MATLFEIDRIEITLNEGIISIRQQYKSPITIPVMYVPILIQMIEEVCDKDKKEREASNG